MTDWVRAEVPPEDCEISLGSACGDVDLAYDITPCRRLDDGLPFQGERSKK